MDERNSTERLTQREREALRGWLQHKTAKEIALDLGVSHYAVEKRLKTARLKLGVSSSLEAARMLANADGYGRTVAQPADLPAPEALRNKWLTRPIILGAATMSVITALILAFALQGASGGSDLQPQTPASDAARNAVVHQGGSQNMVEASLAEIVSITQTTFQHLDEDNSGFLERTESPVSAHEGPQPVYRRDEDGRVVPTGEMVERNDENVRDEFYERADKNGDDRISYTEYHQWSAPNLVRSGIPADWKEDMSSWMSPEG